MSPRSARPPRRTRRTAAPPSEQSTATRAEPTATAARPTPQENTTNPWWEVDLGADYPIDSVVVWNRTDGDFYKRLNRYTLKVLDANRNVVFEADNLPAPGETATTEVGGTGADGAVRRAAMLALTSVRGKEAETFKALARFVRGEGSDRTAAIRAISRIPVADWPADEAGPTLDALLAYIKTIPPRDRTSATALDALQLGDSLAGLLPADRATRARRELGDLGVRVIRLGTVTDQMLFDKDRIAAQAGKPVEIVFENTDIMPHNFVVTRPGALEEVGLLGESSSTQPGALERNYVPPSDKILVASRLLAPRDSQKLSFTAPTRPGVYPYVCTYPGHWRRMYGAFYVVADIAAYLADPTGLPGRPPACRSSTTCSRTTARARSGPSTTWPRRSKALEQRPVVRQRQADLRGRELRRVPPDERRRRAGRPRPRPARRQDDQGRDPPEPARTVGQDRREVPDARLHHEVGQGGHRDDPGRDPRADQGDREPAGQDRAGRSSIARTSRNAPSRRPRSCPRACSTS